MPFDSCKNRRVVEPQAAGNAPSEHLVLQEDEAPRELTQAHRKLVAAVSE